MIVLNNKIYLELLEDDLQPKKTFLNTDADLLKYCNVLDGLPGHLPNCGCSMSPVFDFEVKND